MEKMMEEDNIQEKAPLVVLLLPTVLF